VVLTDTGLNDLVRRVLDVVSEHCTNNSVHLQIKKFKNCKIKFLNKASFNDPNGEIQ